jgi:hypothetical protein
LERAALYERPFFYANLQGVKHFILFGLLLSACNKDQPAAPTAEQSAQLNEAEDMLNGVAQNEEGPADRSASPSNQSN